MVVDGGRRSTTAMFSKDMPFRGGKRRRPRGHIDSDKSWSVTWQARHKAKSSIALIGKHKVNLGASASSSRLTYPLADEENSRILLLPPLSNVTGMVSPQGLHRLTNQRGRIEKGECSIIGEYGDEATELRREIELLREENVLLVEGNDALLLENTTLKELCNIVQQEVGRCRRQARFWRKKARETTKDNGKVSCGTVTDASAIAAATQMHAHNSKAAATTFGPSERAAAVAPVACASEQAEEMQVLTSPPLCVACAAREHERRASVAMQSFLRGNMARRRLEKQRKSVLALHAAEVLWMRRFDGSGRATRAATVVQSLARSFLVRKVGVQLRKSGRRTKYSAAHAPSGIAATDMSAQRNKHMESVAGCMPPSVPSRAKKKKRNDQRGEGRGDIVLKDLV